MLHICSKEFKFRTWSALPMVQLATASLSGENLLILPTVLAPLFSDCSPRCSTAVWRLYLACDWTEKMISSRLCSKSLFIIWCLYQLSCLAWLCLLVEKEKGKKNSHAHILLPNLSSCAPVWKWCCFSIRSMHAYHPKLWSYTYLTITNSLLVNHIFFWRLHQILFDGFIFVTVNPGFYFLLFKPLSWHFLPKKLLISSLSIVSPTAIKKNFLDQKQSAWSQSNYWYCGEAK